MQVLFKPGLFKFSGASGGGGRWPRGAGGWPGFSGAGGPPCGAARGVAPAGVPRHAPHPARVVPPVAHCVRRRGPTAQACFRHAVGIRSWKCVLAPAALPGALSQAVAAADVVCHPLTVRGQAFAPFCRLTVARTRRGDVVGCIFPSTRPDFAGGHLLTAGVHSLQHRDGEIPVRHCVFTGTCLKTVSSGVVE